MRYLFLLILLVGTQPAAAQYAARLLDPASGSGLLSGDTFSAQVIIGQAVNGTTSNDAIQMHFGTPAFIGQLNAPPVANAGADVAAECSGPDGATITLNGSASSDPEGTPLAYTWTDAEGTVLATGATPSVVLPLGLHIITLVVEDGHGGADSDTVEVTVADTTAPTFALATGVLVLWPPDHTYHVVSFADVGLTVTDACDAGLSVADAVFTGGTSDEEENGHGDGNTTDDMVFPTCTTAMLRTERAGHGDGRVYEVSFSAKDASGNTATGGFIVSIPQNRNGDPAIDSGDRYTVASGCPAPAASVVGADRNGPQAGALGNPISANVLPGPDQEVPSDYALEANYPNPFNPQTTLEYALPEPTAARLVVYDALGREVAVLMDGKQAAGHHKVIFDASGMPSGVYLYRLTTGTRSFTRTMLLLK